MRFSPSRLKAEGFSIMPEAREHRVSIGLMLLEFYYFVSIVIAELPFAHSQQVSVVALFVGSFMAGHWVLRGFQGRARYYLDGLEPNLRKSLDSLLLAGIGLQMFFMFDKPMPILGLCLCAAGFLIVEVDAILLMLPHGRRINPQFLPESESEQ